MFLNLLFFLSLGWGTDEKAIVAVLGYRNAGQRRQIRIAYEQLFEEDLVKRFESELSGHLEVRFHHILAHYSLIFIDPSLNHQYQILFLLFAIIETIGLSSLFYKEDRPIFLLLRFL